MVPQAPAGLPLTLNVTVSPTTEVPPNVATPTVKLSVPEPDPATVDEVGVTVTTFCGAVWVIEIVVLEPEPDSVAVMVQVPTVEAGP
jgi:hypothetical protein